MLRNSNFSSKYLRLLLTCCLLCIVFLNCNSIKVTILQAADTNNQITLEAYNYHQVPIIAEEDQAISGDWEVTPADVIFPPFLVFIVDSEQFEEWKNSDNLTQAVNRIPSENLLYLYDPFFVTDDFPFDNYRTGTFQTKVPYNDTWYLVFYAGTTLVPLTFSWSFMVVESYLFDIVMYSLVGVVVLALGITVTIIYIRKRKTPIEDEIEQLIEKQKIKDEQASKRLGSLEEIDDNDEYKQLK